jgi:hypothetical protein
LIQKKIKYRFFVRIVISLTRAKFVPSAGDVEGMIKGLPTLNDFSTIIREPGVPQMSIIQEPAVG